jgi:3-hydroxyisobutyrate dehydrogenase-like beta-hydroxyacid dehydrogenase
MADVGVLHPGEMGSAVGAVARADVWWAPEGRSEATAARAGAAGLRPAPLGELLRRCEVVLSICPPHGALALAEDVARLGFSGLYCDANAISPATATTVASTVEGGGATFVDGGIVGGPPAAKQAGGSPGGGSTTRLYLSGAEADRVVTLFEGTPLEPAVLGDEIGTASALKMLYAAWSKASAALLLAIAEASERLGIADELRAEWERSVPGLSDRLAVAVRSADAKGWRWVAEMREIEATLRSVDVPGGFHAAAAEVFDRR